MKRRDITSTATEGMRWGTFVTGDSKKVWPAEVRGDAIGVLVRPIGERDACEPGETVAVRTDGHILALIDGSGVSVMLRRGKVVSGG